MSLGRSVTAAALLIAGIVVLVLGWAGGPPLIAIRWTPGTTGQVRESVERSLGLTNPRFDGNRTWVYDLRDPSRAHLERILRHPAYEDWSGINRDFTLKPDAPPLQAWLQIHYQLWPFNWLAASWLVVGPMLCLLGLVAGWPLVVSVTTDVDWRLAAVLIASIALRVWLIFGGGQYYWPDERQYREARQVAAAAFAGETGWLHALLATPSSVVLKLFAFPPAAIEQLTGENPHVPALFFGLCSVGTIWLTAAVVRRLNGNRDEAFVAGLLAGASTALLYMSRHILTYDLALMLGMAGVFTGVSRDGGNRASILTGIWAIAAFFAYAGAWTLAGAACAIHVADAPSIRSGLRRGAIAVCGIASVIALFTLAYRAAGLSWFERMVAFAGTVRQGEFDEGWRLPFEYLWHAEHLLLMLWAVAIAACIVRPRWSVMTRVTRAGLVGAICIYAGLAVTSTVLQQFVVYGRLARPLVPFFCLLTAGVLGALLRHVGRRRSAALAAVTVAVAGQAAVNFQTPIRQQFPPEFIARVERRYPEPRLFVNAKHLYPGPEAITPPAGYREVASAAHPLEFLPYQYEGYAEGERRGLRRSDLRMRAWVGPQQDRREGEDDAAQQPR